MPPGKRGWEKSRRAVRSLKPYPMKGKILGQKIYLSKRQNLSNSLSSLLPWPSLVAHILSV
jgi:hypothetical protein